MSGISPIGWLPPELIPEMTSFFDEAKTVALFERTCKSFCNQTNLYEAATKLIKYTVERAPTRKESLIFLNAYQSPTFEEKESVVQMQQFYEVFKNRMKELHVHPNSEKFKIAVKTVQERLFSAIRQLPEYNAVIDLGRKMGTLREQFETQALDHIVQSYAQQKIDAISPSSFQITIDLIVGWLHPDQIPPILIGAIRKHHSKEDIEAIRKEFLNASPGAPRLLEAKKRIERELIQERADLNKEMAELRGSSGFNGSIHEAYCHMKLTAKYAESVIAEEVVKTQQERRDWISRWMKHDTPLQMMDVLKGGLEGIEHNILGLFEMLAKRKEEAAHEFAQQVENLEYIAVFDATGQIVSGRLNDIKSDLQPDAIEAAAREDLDKRVHFYGRLLENI